MRVGANFVASVCGGAPRSRKFGSLLQSAAAAALASQTHQPASECRYASLQDDVEVGEGANVATSRTAASVRRHVQQMMHGTTTTALCEGNKIWFWFCIRCSLHAFLICF